VTARERNKSLEEKKVGNLGIYLLFDVGK